MVKSYCVKQKKITECIPDSARLVAECGITKTKFVKQSGNGLARRRGRAY